MDPSEMYVGLDHGSWWWAGFLTLMALMVVVLATAFLAGVGRAYAARPTASQPRHEPGRDDDLADAA